MLKFLEWLSYCSEKYNDERHAKISFDKIYSIRDKFLRYLSKINEEHEMFICMKNQTEDFSMKNFGEFGGNALKKLSLKY